MDVLSQSTLLGVGYEVETGKIQTVLDTFEFENKRGRQTMAHVKHLLGGFFDLPFAQGHLPKGTVNVVFVYRDRRLFPILMVVLTRSKKCADAHGIAGATVEERSRNGATDHGLSGCPRLLLVHFRL